MKLRVGDTVQVMTGKDRGKRGKIEFVVTKHAQVVVEKVNRVKKHLKPSRQFPKGGIVQVGRPIASANVQLVCPHCGKLTRVGAKLVGEDAIRVCKKCGKALDEKGKK